MTITSRSRRIWTLLFALAIVAVGAVAAAPPSSAVVGGSTASEGEYPFMASIQDPDGFAFCGGSVIAGGWVLTAAHCVQDTDADELRVVTGRTNLADTSRGQVLAVSAVHVHPNWDSATLSYDAALLRLATPTVSPAIRLAGAADDGLEAPGTPVRVTGWGDQTPTFGLLATNQMREVDLEVVSDQQCGETNFGFDPATGVCAEALLKDSCNGDSGGPLFATVSGARIQIGIVSYGTSCGVPRFPGVYSEVNNTSIRSWISTTAGV